MNMEIAFPGGVAVDATYRGFTVHTDQPPPLGEDTGPSPFNVFLASIGACAGYYALRFCQERGIDTANLKVGLSFDRNAETKRVSKVRIHVTLPPGFPERYRQPILRTIDQCTVKKHIVEPPEFEVELT